MQYFFSVNELNVTLSNELSLQRKNSNSFVDGNDENDSIGDLPETIP